MFIKESIFINSELERTYMSFYDFSVWEKILDDVERVCVFYDDGVHQEFSMTVRRPAGQETIRGFRFCVPFSSISLCQTIPPPGFKKMVGEWTFQHDKGGCLVTALRSFDLFDSSQEKITSEKLSGILRKNLTSFRGFVESFKW